RRLHLGVSYAAYSGLSGRRFRAHAATHQASRFADTGTIADVDAYTTLGLELGLVYGPWSVQAEYILADVDSAAADDPQLSGGYAYVSYWLTGECRPYSRGLFGRPKPCCNFLDNECCCRGALELKARYEFLDLDDGGIDGGELSAITLGVNWHLNPNTRLMFEWFRAEYEGTPAGYDADPDVAGIQTVTFDDDVVSGVQMRFQVDF
nr:porin [Planctomycetota bacterium]